MPSGKMFSSKQTTTKTTIDAAVKVTWKKNERKLASEMDEKVGVWVNGWCVGNGKITK